MCCTFPFVINVLTIDYNGENQKYAWSPLVIIDGFHYYAQKSCWQCTQRAVILSTIHTPSFRLLIVNMVFADLSDCSLLDYHCGINRQYGGDTAVHILIRNVIVIHNSAAGFGYVIMFSIELNNFESLSKISNSIKFESVRFYDTLTIKFYDCSFMKNSNIDTMVHVSPLAFPEIVAYIVISNTTFHSNKDVHFLKVEREDLPNMNTHVFLTNLKVSNNDHQKFGGDLIFITDRHVRMANNVFIGS